MEISEAARSVARSLGYSSLKDKQLEVIENFVSGHDVFAVLPTGYGKSLCRIIMEQFTKPSQLRIAMHLVWALTVQMFSRSSIHQILYILHQNLTILILHLRQFYKEFKCMCRCALPRVIIYCCTYQDCLGCILFLKKGLKAKHLLL